MPYDLVIKNGTVIDGSGLPGYRADVGVTQGRIAAIGRIREQRPRGRRRRGPRRRARLHRRPHAHGRPDLLGPARHLLLLARHHQRRHGQLRLHARAVRREGQGHGHSQPRARRGHLRRRRWRRASTGAGRPSPSTSTPSTSLPKGINYSGYIGHSALRTYVMGERAFEQTRHRGRPRRHGARACATAMRAGAMGFTTSRSPTHETPDGRPVASRVADLGRGAAARRRDGRDGRRHLRAGRRGRGPRPGRSGPARVSRAPARPRGGDGTSRSPSASSAGATRRTCGGSTSRCSTRRRRGRPHVRPGAQPLAERAAVVQDPDAVRPAARVEGDPRAPARRAAAEAPRPRAAPPPRRGVGRAHGQRALGTEARTADYDRLLVFDTVHGPAPLGGRDGARAGPAPGGDR